jgi:hypothetical protein
VELMRPETGDCQSGAAFGGALGVRSFRATMIARTPQNEGPSFKAPVAQSDRARDF